MSTTTAGPNTHLWPAETLQETKVRGYWGSVALRLSRDKATLVFGFILALTGLAAIFAPLIAPFDPYKESIVGRLKPFGWRGHALGTDELGRGLLTRIICRQNRTGA